MSLRHHAITPIQVAVVVRSDARPVLTAPTTPPTAPPSCRSCTKRVLGTSEPRYKPFLRTLAVPNGGGTAQPNTMRSRSEYEEYYCLHQHGPD